MDIFILSGYVEVYLGSKMKFYAFNLDELVDFRSFICYIIINYL